MSEYKQYHAQVAAAEEELKRVTRVLEHEAKDLFQLHMNSLLTPEPLEAIEI